MHVFIGIIFTICNSMRIKHESMAYVCLYKCIDVCCIDMGVCTCLFVCIYYTCLCMLHHGACVYIFCLSVCVWLCIPHSIESGCVYTHVCLHMRLFVCICLHVHFCRYVCVYAAYECLVYVCLYIYMCVHIRVRVQEKTMCVMFFRFTSSDATSFLLWKEKHELILGKYELILGLFLRGGRRMCCQAWVFSLFSTLHVRGVFFSFSSAVFKVCLFQCVQLLILRMLCTVTSKNTKNTMHFLIQCIFCLSWMKYAFFLDEICIVVCKHILFFMHELCCNHA